MEIGDSVDEGHARLDIFLSSPAGFWRDPSARNYFRDSLFCRYVTRQMSMLPCPSTRVCQCSIRRHRSKVNVLKLQRRYLGRKPCHKTDHLPRSKLVPARPLGASCGDAIMLLEPPRRVRRASYVQGRMLHRRPQKIAAIECRNWSIHEVPIRLSRRTKSLWTTRGTHFFATTCERWEMTLWEVGQRH